MMSDETNPVNPSSTLTWIVDPLPKRGRPFNPQVIDWSKVDWNKGTVTIARELRTNPATVTQQRKEFAPHTVQKRGPKIKPDWSVVDWSKKNTEIAASLGVYISGVSHARAKYAPETLGKRRSLRQMDAEIKAREQESQQETSA